MRVAIPALAWVLPLVVLTCLVWAWILVRVRRRWVGPLIERWITATLTRRRKS
jgi:hypothetical protein